MIQRLGLTEVSFVGDDRTRFLGNALDWVFARELSVVTAQVRKSINGSDHKPMEVVFSLPD
jgi:endonuclease/exonuclease/phosphatase (EEP) superfamily protein YafD